MKKGKLLAITLLGASPSFAQQAGLPEGAADAFRVDTQYGSSKAVLNPVFGRDGKLELNLGGAYSVMSSLMSFYSLTGSAVFHINMRHAIEPVWFGWVQGAGQSSFVDTEITAKVTDAQKATLAVEIPEQIWAASYFFSPYYTKMHMTERSVAHFDVYMGVGPGLVRGREWFLDGHQGVLTNHFGASFAAGIRFLVPSRWALRLEVRDVIHGVKHFNEVATGNTLQVAASLGFFFGKSFRVRPD